MQKNNPKQDERIAKMLFADVYPSYVAKVERKGRTKAELNEVIKWLTGFDDKKLQHEIESTDNFAQFFDHATLHPNAHKITGVICGYRIEEITNPLTKKVRYLDKLIDDLAKGKSLDKLLH